VVIVNKNETWFRDWNKIPADTYYDSIVISQAYHEDDRENVKKYDTDINQNDQNRSKRICNARCQFKRP
jgi:hypothetical protein